ncbi:MAG: hypothetical protein HOI11_17720 [Gammaproteobacteria bacterium]|jgi:hypothetical protein|nr:hypothetical protein [Acidiferrobacteraceae bacterium]MBT5792309.1 hypothetical protein [Gammaproteobacteria bacterium]MBT7795569.1 hypothetical protein [Gammaproteobacteria bacterium]
MDTLEYNRQAFALRSSQVIVLTAVLWGITVTSASFYRLTRKGHGRILAATERAGG